MGAVLLLATFALMGLGRTGGVVLGVAAAGAVVLLVRLSRTRTADPMAGEVEEFLDPAPAPHGRERRGRRGPVRDRLRPPRKPRRRRGRPERCRDLNVHRNGTITALDTAATGQAATCWIVYANGTFYASNAGIGTISAYHAGAGGKLTALGTTSTDAATATTSMSRPAPRGTSTSTGSTRTSP